jgi:hypothetical protein
MKNLVPKSISRLAGRSMLKLNANSPTILVVAGVVGLGATAVLAARATRNLDPVIENHRKERAEIGYVSKTDKVVRKQQQTAIMEMYYNTSLSLVRVYGPTIAVGTISAASVLWGHRILKARHVATMMAYSGLQDQFLSYRGRVAQTLGEKAEKDIYDGAHGEWVEDPNHKGEYKLEPKFESGETPAYLRPFFDEYNQAWTKDPMSNWLFLKGAQSHLNNLLQARGHVFLFEAYDALRIPRTPDSMVAGWLWRPNSPNHQGDNYVDFGFMTGNDPVTVSFQRHEQPSVRLNFNIDGIIYQDI